MVRKRIGAVEQKPYWYNKDISLIFEIKVGRVVISSGDLIRVKHERSVFRFNRLVVNVKSGKEWIDVYDTSLGGWRSFTPDQIIGPYTAKRSRSKKVKRDE